MAPNPGGTCWNAWFSAVQYHSEYFGLHKEFIELEMEVGLNQIKVIVQDKILLKLFLVDP